jgi:hypothetical protein
LLGGLLDYFFDPEDGGDMFLRNVGLQLNGLHGVTSQKMILFITTAVKISNPTFIRNVFAPINIQQVTLKVHSEIHMGLSVSCPLFLSDLNQNRLNQQLFIKSPQYKIS